MLGGGSEQTEVVRSKLGAPRSKRRWFGASSEHLGVTSEQREVVRSKLGAPQRPVEVREDWSTTSRLGLCVACLCARAAACVRVRDWLACVQGCARARARVCAPVRMCPRCACVHSARACGVCVRAGVHMCACGACADGCRCACCVPLRVCACVHACMLTWVCVRACTCVCVQMGVRFLCATSVWVGTIVCRQGSVRLDHHGWVLVGGLGREG